MEDLDVVLNGLMEKTFNSIFFKTFYVIYNFDTSSDMIVTIVIIAKSTTICYRSCCYLHSHVFVDLFQYTGSGHANIDSSIAALPSNLRQIINEI